MSRTVTITLDNGQKVVYQNTPDEVTPEQVTARAQQENPGRTVTELDGGKSTNILQDIVRHVNEGDVTRGVMKVGSSLGGMMGTMVAGRFAKPDQAPALGRQVEEVLNKQIERVVPTPQGGSSADTYIRAGLEGAGGGLVSPGAGVARGVNLAAGTGSGLGSEFAAKLLGDNPLSRVLGAVLGGGLSGSVASRGSRAVAATTQELAQAGLEGIPDALLAKAKVFHAEAAKQGIPLDFAQALEAVGVPPGNLTTLRNVLAGSQSGHNVKQQLQNQPSQLSVRSDLFMGQQPGTVWGEAQAANNLAEGAGKRMQQARTERTNATQPDYKAAGRLPAQFRTNFASTITEMLYKPGTTQEAGQALSEALAKVKKLPNTGQPVWEATDYDTIIQELQGAFKGLQRQPKSPRSEAQIAAVADNLRTLLRDADPNLKRAAETYARISTEVVDPLKQGPIGELLGPGYMPDKQASVAKMKQLFNAGVDPRAQLSPVKQAGRELAKVEGGAEVFADAFKTHISMKISNAFEPVVKGATPTNHGAAQAVWDALFAKAPQYQAMQDAVEVIAQGMGKSQKETVAALRGLENYAQLTKALKSRPSQTSGLGRSEVFKMGGQNFGADALRIGSFMPFERYARKLEDWKLRSTFTELDSLLTTKAGIDQLIALSKQPVMSRAAVTMFATMGSNLATQPAPVIGE